jgi:phosphate uptake regulator
MEKRRIMRLGKSSLTVSLPLNWIQKTGLKKGDHLVIATEKDGSLRIMPDVMVSQMETPKSCTINTDLCNAKDLLLRMIVASYIKGYDIINIASSKRIGKDNIEAIRNAELSLMGLSIVEETSSRMTLQCSINASMFPIDLAIRRLYSLFLTMGDEAIDALTNSNLELAKEAQRREREANMMYALILRLLNQAQSNYKIAKMIGIDVNDIMNMLVVANTLERNADWAFRIAENVGQIENSGVTINGETIKRITEYYEKIKKICDEAMKSQFTYDIRLANNAINHFKDVLDAEAYEIIEKLSLGKIYYGFGELRQIILILRRIGEITISIAESTIDKALEKGELCDFELQTSSTPSPRCLK